MTLFAEVKEIGERKREKGLLKKIRKHHVRIALTFEHLEVIKRVISRLREPNPVPIPPNYTADWQRSKHLMILYGLGSASDEDNEDLDTEDEDLFSDMEDEDEDGDEDGEDMDEEENN